MPRRAGTGNRAVAGLALKETRRRLHYGDFSPIAGILDTVRLVSAIGGKKVSRTKQAHRNKALLFLGKWVCKATSEQLKLLSRWKGNPDHIKQPADWLFHLQTFGVRIAEKGETWVDALQRIPHAQLLNELAAKGVKVDPATLRNGLNSIGIKRPSGRPRKNRDLKK